MLKWFQKYNKLILVIGGSLLMVSFLLIDSLGRFGESSRQNEPVAYVDDEAITYEHVKLAELEISLLTQIHPLLGNVAEIKPLQWILAIEEARQMGLNASNNNINLLLSELNRMPFAQNQQSEAPEEIITRVALEAKVDKKIVRNALRKWLTYQTYTEKMRGLAHTPLPNRVQNLAQMIQFAGMMRNTNNFQQQMQMRALINQLAGDLAGTPRFNENLARRYAWQNSQLRLNIVAIPVKGEVKSQATEEQLRELFETYRDLSPERDLAQKDDYAFGYRQPNKVKLSYLKLPVTQAKSLKEVKRVESKEMLKYYNDNKAEFKGEFSSVQKTIKERIIHERATEKLMEMVQQIRDRANKALRVIKRGDDGFYQFTEEQSKLAVDQLATSVQSLNKDGFNASWVEHEAWLAQDDLNQLDGIGQSRSIDQMPFNFYALSTKEIFEEKPQLQVGVPSKPMRDSLGNYYLFILTDASKEQPASELALVKSQLEKDAALKAAFEAKLTDLPSIISEARRLGLEAFAKVNDAKVENAQPFTQRQVSPMAGGVITPFVQGVGNDQTFVDSAFAFAHEYAGGKSKLLSPITVIPIKNQSKLFVIEVLEFIPPSDQQIAAELTSFRLNSRVRQDLLTPIPGQAAEDAQQALQIEKLMSEDAIARRLKVLNADRKPWNEEDRKDEEASSSDSNQS